MADDKALFDVGNLVRTACNRFIGVVYKVEKTGTDFLYHCCWNDGDFTSEDGRDIELVVKGSESETKPLDKYGHLMTEFFSS